MSFFADPQRIAVTFSGRGCREWLLKRAEDSAPLSPYISGRFSISYGDVGLDATITLIGRSDQEWEGFENCLEALQAVTEALAELPDIELLAKCSVSLDVQL